MPHCFGFFVNQKSNFDSDKENLKDHQEFSNTYPFQLPNLKDQITVSVSQTAYVQSVT